MFNTNKLWAIAALVCLTGVATAQATFHVTPIRDGPPSIGGKITPIPPGAGEALCFGDGSGAKCPVNNPGRLGHGCNNSADMGGSVLRVDGTPSVVHDTLVLGVRGLPEGTMTIYMQGGKLRYAPKPLGYGILCLGGTFTRLAVKNAINSTSRYPEFGEPAASGTGNITAGQSVIYQVFYRDSFFGDATTLKLNTSNAWHTVWAP